MKRFIFWCLILVILCALLAVTGCGKSDNGDSAIDGSEDASTESVENDASVASDESAENAESGEASSLSSGVSESSVSDVSAESSTAEASVESSGSDESNEGSKSTAAVAPSKPNDESKFDTSSSISKDESKSDMITTLPKEESKPDTSAAREEESTLETSLTEPDPSQEAPHEHEWGNWREVRRATCDKDGEEIRYCLVPLCDETQTRSVSKYTEHDLYTLQDTAYCRHCDYTERLTLTADDAERVCKFVIQVLNEERAALGAPALSTAPIAHEMATVRAEELTVYFSHTRPDGSDAQKAVYQEYEYGIPTKYGLPEDEWHLLNEEEIATAPIVYSCPGSEDILKASSYGYGYTSIERQSDEAYIATAKEIIAMFKTSDGHWADLTNAEYTGIGVGYANKDGLAYTAILTMDKTYG